MMLTLCNLPKAQDVYRDNYKVKCKNNVLELLSTGIVTTDKSEDGGELPLTLSCHTLTSAYVSPSS